MITYNNETEVCAYKRTWMLIQGPAAVAQLCFIFILLGSVKLGISAPGSCFSTSGVIRSAASLDLANHDHSACVFLIGRWNRNRCAFFESLMQAGTLRIVVISYG